LKEKCVILPIPHTILSAIIGNIQK